MASSSVSSSSPTSSPTLRRPADPSISAVTAAAASRLNPSPTSLIQLSKNAETPKSRIRQKYHEARQLLKDNPEKARALFLELITTLDNDKSIFGNPVDNYIASGDCFIGVAVSYRNRTIERKDYAVKAKDLLDTAFEEALKGDAIDMITNFQKMRNLYEELTPLVPLDQTVFHGDVKAKLEECSRRIPVLSNFYKKLIYALKLLSQGQPDRARDLLGTVMPTIEGNDKAEFILARAHARLFSSKLPGDSSKKHLEEAQDLAFAAYERREELYTNEDAKITALKLFKTVFEELRRLIPTDDAVHLLIKVKLEKCRKELDLQPTEEPDSGKTPPDRKVTPDPVADYWKPARLFIAFSFAAAVIVGTAVLGRRLITQLN